MGKKAAAKRLVKRLKSGVSDTPERQKMEQYFAGKKGAVDDVSDDDLCQSARNFDHLSALNFDQVSGGYCGA